jgi:hypothetical protein
VANGFGYQEAAMTTRKVKKQALPASFIFLTQQQLATDFISLFVHSTTLNLQISHTAGKIT